MDIENFISYRYLTSSKGKFLSFLNVVSIGGVAIGVMALVVVLAVMTGFGSNLRDKIIGTTPHIVVEKESGLEDFNGVRQELLSIEDVQSASPYIQGNVFLETASGKALGQIVRGIVPETEVGVTKIQEYLKQGSLDDLHDDSVIIGSELARYFGYRVGDEVTLISPGSGIEGRGWRYRLKIVGIFNSGMVDLDTNLLLVSLQMTQKIFNYPDDIATGVGIKVTDPEDAADVKMKIYEELGFSYLVKTWIDVNRGLFQALKLEKFGMALVLIFMVIVASFNIISTLIVTVTSKTHDIGILQSFGVTKSSIRRVFIKQGILIGMAGIFLGVFLGIGTCYILTNYIKVPFDIYAIEHVPVDLQLVDLLIIMSSAILIAFLATIYPATKAASLQTVDALRYE